MKTALEAIDVPLHSAVSVRPMTVNDFQEVISLFRCFPEVSCEEWENFDLFARILTQFPTTSLVARDGERVIGAVVAGIMGTRATTNHIAVADAYRSQGVGQLLVSRVLESCKAIGIHRLFLFVLCSNHAAQRVFRLIGFREIPSELTMELDF